MLSYYPYSFEWPEAYGSWRDAVSPIFSLGVKGKQVISCQFLEFFLSIQAGETVSF